MGGDHRVGKTASDDGAMEAAIAMARETVLAEIDPFLAGLRPEFMVKVAITDAHEQTEHMWLGDVSFSDGTFAGHITWAPHALQGYQEGQRFRISPDGISDWMYYLGWQNVGKFYSEGDGALDAGGRGHKISRLVGGLEHLFAFS